MKTSWMYTSDWVIGGSLFLTLLWNGTCSLFSPGWIAASLICGINWIIFIVYFLIKRNQLLKRLMLFAIVAGWVELLTDKWLVDITNSLVYQPGGPFVIRSPLYMPFAWGVVLIQTGYIGWRLLKFMGRGPTILLTGTLGASTIPLYEWWAKGAMWWYYQDTRMWGVVPIYIILGEFMIAGGLVLLVERLEEKFLWVTLLFGVIQGLWIWFCYVVAYSLVG